MKTGKVILGLLVLVIAGLAITIFVGLNNLNGLVKTIVEQEAPKLTGTTVTLDSVNITLTEGRGELHGLTIGNPAGYTSGYAISLGDVALQIEPSSLTGDVIVIKEVLVNSVALIAEQRDMTKTNLQDLLDTVKKRTASTGTSDTSQADPNEEKGSDVRLMIEKFTFSGSKVQLITQQWGEKTISLPEIKLTNIGDKKTGLSPEEIGNAVLQPLLAQAKASVSKKLKELAQDKAEDKLKEAIDEKLNDEEKEKLNQLKGILGR